MKWKVDSFGIREGERTRDQHVVQSQIAANDQFTGNPRIGGNCGIILHCSSSDYPRQKQG